MSTEVTTKSSHQSFCLIGIYYHKIIETIYNQLIKHDIDYLLINLCSRDCSSSRKIIKEAHYVFKIAIMIVRVRKKKRKKNGIKRVPNQFASSLENTFNFVYEQNFIIIYNRHRVYILHVIDHHSHYFIIVLMFTIVCYSYFLVFRSVLRRIRTSIILSVGNIYYKILKVRS